MVAVIVFALTLSQICVDIFKEKGHTADVKNGVTPQQLSSIIGDYDGMVVRSATKVNLSVLSICYVACGSDTPDCSHARHNTICAALV